jgi:hypothetical protein
MKTFSFPLRTLWIVTLFFIALGYIESAVVIYMREILYPEGFQFPLAPIEIHLAITEILREIATLIVLLCIGMITGRTFTEKFAWFIYSFAVWDIFYYVFLKLLIGWPESFMTWDILFLIPVTWVGPVITPLILTFTMILLSMILVYYNKKYGIVKMNRTEWILLIIGSIILILSWTWDYSGYILEHFTFREIWTIPSEDLYSIASQYIPRKFNWGLFWIGEAIILSGIGFTWKRLIIKARTVSRES